jgi:Sulphur transport
LLLPSQLTPRNNGTMTVITIASVGFIVAFVCAALMGYAIQRGATCMVAALEEVVTERRANRLIALAEAGIWVAGGLIVASLFSGLAMTPVGYAVGVGTVLGGVLLGIGALINRACVFGSIARLGSGEWAYILTPFGFLAGCVVTRWLMIDPAPATGSSPLLKAAQLLVVPFALFAGWRGVEALQAVRQRAFAAHIWTPHRATMVIGLAFVVMLLTVGSWAYTEALASLARGMVSNTPAKLLLLVALLVGALTGGWTAGRLRVVMPSIGGLARCFTGGALMGLGSVMIPGSNDGLILLGLPLLQPHAYVALSSMAVAIIGGMAIERRLIPN